MRGFKLDPEYSQTSRLNLPKILTQLNIKTKSEIGLIVLGL